MQRTTFWNGFLSGRRDIETPNFFAVTSRGVVHILHPDVLSAYTQIGGVHMALEKTVKWRSEITCLFVF